MMEKETHHLWEKEGAHPEYRRRSNSYPAVHELHPSNQILTALSRKSKSNHKKFTPTLLSLLDLLNYHIFTNSSLVLRRQRKARILAFICYYQHTQIEMKQR